MRGPPAAGTRGVVVVDLDPEGVVRVAGEDWSAVLVGATRLAAESTVEVVDRRGLRLVVRPADPAAARAAAAGEPPDWFAPLSRREAEVAGLVARGLSNKQIAAELIVAETTVDRHVSHILGKLGFAGRAQVAVWVAERRTAGAVS
jgi:DNA-binding NarL/FixJ family response regulator